VKRRSEKQWKEKIQEEVNEVREKSRE